MTELLVFSPFPAGWRKAEAEACFHVLTGVHFSLLTAVHFDVLTAVPLSALTGVLDGVGMGRR